MQKLFLSVFLLIVTYASDNIKKPEGSIYLEGTQESAMILMHGKGKSPTWKVVDPLRKNINKSLGFHTLSLQMPITDGNFQEYADAFPDAYITIEEAIKFLEERKVKNIYFFGHSMGSRMASAFLAKNKKPSFKGLIVAGCRNNGKRVLSCANNVEDINIPILDIWGSQNKKDSKAALKREAFISTKYTQIELTGANHQFDGYDNQLNGVILQWLEERKNN
jgi:predicted alpha/beta-hydrolase family hydrolase